MNKKFQELKHNFKKFKICQNIFLPVKNKNYVTNII